MRRIIETVCTGSICLLAGIVFGEYRAGHKYCQKLMDSRKLADKHLYMVRVYDAWMMVKQNGSSMEKYLQDKEIYAVAIYGMSYMGIRLFHELKDSSIRVEYGLDKQPKFRIPDLRIYHPEKACKKDIDAVIVTSIFVFDEVKENLDDLGFTNIISLDEILYDLI